MIQAPLRVEIEIAVFAKGTRTNGIPACRMDREGAQYQVDCGYARWVNNRYKSILMLVDAANFKIRDRSCCMSDGVSDLAVMGDHAALALVARWRPVFYGVYCEWPQRAA